MRIAHLCQTYPPMISGQASMTKQLADGLVTLRHHNFIFAASDLGQSYHSSEGRLGVHRAKSFSNPARVGQRLFLWPYTSLIQKLSQFNPHIIHVHDPVIPSILGIKAKKELNIPALITAHQVPSFISTHFPKAYSFDEHIENLLWKYAKWSLSNYEGIVAPSNTIAELISARTGYKVDTISNGINLDVFNRAPTKAKKKRALKIKFRLHPDKPIILHVGQINFEKRVDIAVKAALKVMESSVAQLLVVGDGNQMTSIKRICARQGLMNDCHFTGYIHSKEKLVELYSISNVFITGSTIETQGLVLLEAAASGLPIVGVDATCIPELVHDNKNGFLTPINDVNSMAYAIRRIIDSESLARKMGSVSREIAYDHDFKYSLSKYESLYEQILNDFYPI